MDRVVSQQVNEQQFGHRLALTRLNCRPRSQLVVRRHGLSDRTE